MQSERLGSDCMDAQSDLSLHWSHKSYCRFCRALGQITYAETSSVSLRNLVYETAFLWPRKTITGCFVFRKS